MYISVTFVLSVLIGILAAFGMERLDSGFRTGEQLEKIAHVAPLGLVPDQRTGGQPQDAILTHPISPYSEAIRTARTALRYSDVDNPPKVVLVTSSLPDEGKSIFAISLARSVAFSGGRALLIDCDLRRPTIAKTLNVNPSPGVLSLFDAEPDIKAAVCVEESSGMHFIPSTSGTANPQDLLGSKQFRSLIDRFRADYDLIVLDTPPVLAVSDAIVLSHIADTTMFLVRWGRTARPVVSGALKTVRQNGGHLAGVILSRVDFRRHAAYGYGDSGYFYGYYGKHYGAYDKTYGKG
jgi:capsular exopolysaccharide synthesis family protein